MTRRGLSRFTRPAPDSAGSPTVDTTSGTDPTTRQAGEPARTGADTAARQTDATAREAADATAREAADATTGGPGDGQDIAPVLARFIGARPRPPPGEACEMCATPVADDHRHAVDLERRSLLCVCRGCALLFERSHVDAPAQQGAGAGPLPHNRYRTVPDRYRQITPFTLPGPAWAALQIPVGIAFVVANTQLGRAVAFYPSPGGATESELPLDAWTDIVAANPGLDDVEPDVEAVLLCTDVDELAEPGSAEPGPLADARLPDAQSTFGATTGQDRRRRTVTSTCHIVPVDRCYELVGTLRLHWRGFDGGGEVRAHIAGFFDDVDRRARTQRSQVRT